MFPKRCRLLRVSLLIVLILNSFTNGSTQNSNGSLYAGVENESTEKGTFSQDQSVSIAEQVFGYIAEGIEGTEGGGPHIENIVS